MIYVVASSELKPGCREKFIEIAKANIPNVLAEDGCIFYTLNGDYDSGLAAQGALNENVLTFVECWESMEHLKAHLQAPHMKVFVENVKDLRAGSSLKILSPVC
ncbi:MAG: antibiotic biosynthesis monooxygenase [Lentisphaeria bacterium]|nr:antibiotic biosynthesis monooxygenase [Lentisphaeria bacterium]